MLGHAIGHPLLTAVRVEYRAMSPVTAIALVALSIALLGFGAGWPRVYNLFAAAGGALMLPVLACYVSVGADRFSPRVAAALFPLSTWAHETSRSAALALLLLAIATLARRRPRLADPCSAVALILSLIALLGYAYGVEDLQAMIFFDHLSLTTAVALFLLSIAVFCQRHTVGWAAVVASSYGAGGATRRQLSFLLWPPLVGWFLIQAIRAGHLGAGAATATLVIATVIPLALLVLRDGRRLIALDDAKRSRDAELARIADDTQRQLALQSEQLQGESAERARAEALVYRAQRLEAVGQLTGGIAHDFNNLLMTISGNVQLLERHLAPADPSLRFVAKVRSAVAKGTKVTQQLLAFARSQRLDIRPIAIGAALVDARELLGHSLGPGIEVRLDVGSTEPAAALWAMCDQSQLELAILNLAVNARDAMPNGGTLKISCGVSTLPVPAGSSDAPAACVVVRVADTGVGMAPDVVARAAEPFFTTKEQGKGTGLGLAQVYGFVMQCHGDLRLLSEPGTGTVVEMRFPLAQPPADHEPAPATAPPPTRVPTERRHILVIDDDADVREVIVQALSEAGYRVSQAQDGVSGLVSLQQVEPAVAVIDFLMPGLNGAEVARIARARHPSLPIVFVSGYADTLALEGVTGASVLRKPFDVRTLTRMVESAIAVD